MKFQDLPEGVQTVIGLAYDLSQHCPYDTDRSSISRIIARRLNHIIEEYWPEYFCEPVDAVGTKEHNKDKS
jgi:hypothetical protein